MSTTMDLLPGTCSLCQTSDKILEPNDSNAFIAFVKNTFFERNLKELLQLQEIWNKLRLCVYCAFRLNMSNTFKDQYTRTVSREVPLTTCFVCGVNERWLIRVQSGPDNFDSRIQLFMNSVQTQLDVQDRVICMHCLQSFKYWYDMRKAIFDKLDACCNENTEVAEKSPNESVPHLKKWLSNLNPLSNEKRYETYKDDTKIFNQIPYVLINKKSQINKNGFKTPVAISKTKKNLGASTGKIRKNARLSLRVHSEETPVTPKKITVKTPQKPATEPIIRKPFYRIKFKASKRRQSEHKIKFTQMFICYVCCKNFQRSYEYKAHLLTHEKPQKVVINVTRMELPACVSAKRFLREQKVKSPSVPVDEQKRLILKYIGEEGLKVFDDKDEKSGEVAPVAAAGDQISSTEVPKDVPTEETPETQEGEEKEEVEPMEVTENTLQAEEDTDTKVVEEEVKSIDEQETNEEDIENIKEGNPIEEVEEDSKIIQEEIPSEEIEEEVKIMHEEKPSEDIEKEVKIIDGEKSSEEVEDEVKLIQEEKPSEDIEEEVKIIHEEKASEEIEEEVLSIPAEKASEEENCVEDVENDVHQEANEVIVDSSESESEPIVLSTDESRDKSSSPEIVEKEVTAQKVPKENSTKTNGGLPEEQVEGNTSETETTKRTQNEEVETEEIDCIEIVEEANNHDKEDDNTLETIDNIQAMLAETFMGKRKKEEDELEKLKKSPPKKKVRFACNRTEVDSESSEDFHLALAENSP